MKNKNHPFDVPDKFDLAITKVHELPTDRELPAIILKGAIVKKSLWRRNKLVVTGKFQEKLTAVHLRELLAPALIELGIQDTDELVGTIQHMQKRFVTDVPHGPYNLPRWMPCP